MTAKISGLPAVTVPLDTDQFEVNQGGTSKRMTRGQIVDAAPQTTPGDASVTYSTASHGRFAAFWYNNLSAGRTLTFPAEEGEVGSFVVVRVRAEAVETLTVRLENPTALGTYIELPVPANHMRFIRKEATAGSGNPQWWTDFGYFENAASNLRDGAVTARKIYTGSAVAGAPSTGVAQIPDDGDWSLVGTVDFFQVTDAATDEVRLATPPEVGYGLGTIPAPRNVYVYNNTEVGHSIALADADGSSITATALEYRYIASIGWNGSAWIIKGFIAARNHRHSVADIVDSGPVSASGALTRATHDGRFIVTSGNVTIPNAAGDVGMRGTIYIGSNGHTISFNSISTAGLTAGDQFKYYVRSTTVLARELIAVGDQPAMS